MTNKNLNQKQKDTFTKWFDVGFLTICVAVPLLSVGLLGYEMSSHYQARSRIRDYTNRLAPLVDVNHDGRIDLSERIEFYKKMELPKELWPKSENEKPRVDVFNAEMYLEKALHNYEGEIKPNKK